MTIELSNKIRKACDLYADLDLSGFMQRKKVPGLSLAVMRGGDIVAVLTAGTVCAEEHSPPTADTLFQAASISKPVFAGLVMRLCEEQRLSLDADIAAYLRGFSLRDAQGAPAKVTPRQLLSHSAGVNVHGFEGYPRGEPFPDTLGVLTGKGNSDAIFQQHAPGRACVYSGGGTTLLQKAVEDVLDEPLENSMRRYILEGCAMRNSTYAQPLPQALEGQAASGHRENGDRVATGWHVYPEKAAAGLWTTPLDLLAYGKEIQSCLRGEGTLLRKSTAKTMLTRQQLTGADISLGFFLQGDWFVHSGGNEGFTAYVKFSTEGGHGVAVMTNADGGDAVFGPVLEHVDRLLGWS